MKIVKWMKELVCQNNSSGTSSPFMVTDCLWKIFKGINIARQHVSEKITQEEQSPLIRRQVVWRNYSEQLTEKQNSVKNCTKAPKKETPPINGNRCSFDQKRKSCPYKAGMKRLRSYRSSNLLLWKIFLWKSSTAASRFLQQPTYPTAGEFFQQYLPTIKFQYSTFIEIE